MRSFAPLAAFLTSALLLASAPSLVTGLNVPVVGLESRSDAAVDVVEPLDDDEEGASILSARDGPSFTWYGSRTGKPSCRYFTNKALPQYYAALSPDSPYKCGDQLEILTEWGTSVTVVGECLRLHRPASFSLADTRLTSTAIDTCPECDALHVDLSQSAFKVLTKDHGGLGAGVIASDQIKYIKCNGKGSSAEDDNNEGGAKNGKDGSNNGDSTGWDWDQKQGNGHHGHHRHHGHRHGKHHVKVHRH